MVVVAVVGRPSVCCRPRQSLPMAIHEKGCTQCYGEDRSVANNHNLESSLSLNGWRTGLVAIFTGTGNEDDPS